MSSADGYNPMRWDCERQGCFNIKKRPKIERLAGCLPGSIAFTDVDALVEIKGNLLLLEWKDHGTLSRGQRILFERMTLLCPATVLIVEGDAEQMAVTSIRTAWEGRIGPARAGRPREPAQGHHEMGPLGPGQPRGPLPAEAIQQVSAFPIISKRARQ